MLLQLRNLRLADRHKQLSVAWKQCDFDANPVQNWPGLLRVLQHLSRFFKVCEQSTSRVWWATTPSGTRWLLSTTGG